MIAAECPEFPVHFSDFFEVECRSAHPNSLFHVRRRGTLLSDLIYLRFLEYNWKKKTSPFVLQPNSHYTFAIAVGELRKSVLPFVFFNYIQEIIDKSNQTSSPPSNVDYFNHNLRVQPARLQLRQNHVDAKPIKYAKSFQTSLYNLLNCAITEKGIFPNFLRSIIQIVRIRLL